MIFLTQNFKFLHVLNEVQNQSCLHRRWFTWCFAHWSLWFREPLNLFVCVWLSTDTFFPQEKEIFQRLSHLSGVSILEKNYPNLLCNLRHLPHCSKLTLGDGNLHLVMFTEVSPFDKVPILSWTNVQENPTKSRAS